MSYNSLS